MDFTALQVKYQAVLAQQKFDFNKLDYSCLEKHIPFLEQLSQVGNCAVSVFDLSKGKHVFSSYNFAFLKGSTTSDSEFFNQRIHPEDLPHLIQNGISMFQFGFALPRELRKQFKARNTYRVQTEPGLYQVVVEQHSVLELDPDGHFWLILSVLDLVPSFPFQKAQSEIINPKTLEVIDFSAPPNMLAQSLSMREIEILNLVKEGFLSKEISENLSISVHTVNTHRQKILRKLDVGNSHEALVQAKTLGII